MHRHRITADQVFRFPDTPLPPPETVTQPRQEFCVTVSGIPTQHRRHGVSLRGQPGALVLGIWVKVRISDFCHFFNHASRDVRRSM